MNRRDNCFNSSGRKTATRMKRYNRRIMRRAIQAGETGLRQAKALAKF